MTITTEVQKGKVFSDTDGTIHSDKFNIPGSDGGATTNLTDNKLKFDWGGEIYMDNSSYIRTNMQFHIQGYLNNDMSSRFYLTNSNSGNRWLSGGSSESIGLWVDYGVYANWYYTHSDIRIKNEIETVDDNEAMDIVNKLECKKYHYIDPISKKQYKTIGFIAQEVKENIPNAVVLGNDYIPNILKKSIDFTWEEFGEKWKLKINDYTFENKENYTGMYRLALWDNDSNSEVMEICKLEEDKTFILKKKYKEIFLWGNEINDFHKLDKNMIFSLHHSAIQELSRRNDAKTEKINVLESKVNLLETENTQLKADIALIKQKLGL